MIKNILIAGLLVYALALNIIIAKKDKVCAFNLDATAQMIRPMTSERIDNALHDGCIVVIRKGNARFMRSMNNIDFLFALDKNSTFHIDSGCWNHDGRGTLYERVEYLPPVDRLSPITEFFGVSK